MTDEASVPELLVLLSVGTALFIMGVLHLLGHRWSWRRKAGVTAVIVLGASLAPLTFGNIGLTAAAAGLTVLVGGFLVLVTSGGAATALQAMLRPVRRPATRGALLAVV